MPENNEKPALYGKKSMFQKYRIGGIFLTAIGIIGSYLYSSYLINLAERGIVTAHNFLDSQLISF